MKGRKREDLTNWSMYRRALMEYQHDLYKLWDMYEAAKTPRLKKGYYRLWYYVLCQKHYLQKAYNLDPADFKTRYAAIAIQAVMAPDMEGI